MNEELRRLFLEDQEDRKSKIHTNMRKHDRIRRLRVEQLLNEGAVQTPADYFHAAMIFQHGEVLAHYWQAHELAKKAAAAEYPGASWLATAAYDRWLMCQGKPQKYGTQYILNEDGTRSLWKVKPTPMNEDHIDAMDYRTQGNGHRDHGM